MIKMTVTAEDFDGVEQKEDLWFHLNKKELIDLQQSETGGLGSRLESIANRKDEDRTEDDGIASYEFFLKIVDKSYGIKDVDGKHFRKSPEILDDFKSSVFYDEFIMDLVSNPEKAQRFFQGVMPKSLMDQVSRELNK